MTVAAGGGGTAGAGTTGTVPGTEAAGAGGAGVGGCTDLVAQAAMKLANSSAVSRRLVADNRPRVILSLMCCNGFNLVGSLKFSI